MRQENRITFGWGTVQCPQRGENEEILLNLAREQKVNKEQVAIKVKRGRSQG